MRAIVLALTFVAFALPASVQVVEQVIAAERSQIEARERVDLASTRTKIVHHPSQKAVAQKIERALDNRGALSLLDDDEPCRPEYAGRLKHHPSLADAGERTFRVVKETSGFGLALEENETVGKAVVVWLPCP